MNALLTLVMLTAVPDAPLMKRLAAHAERMETFTRNSSFTVDTVAEEFDSDGKATKTTRTSLRVTRRDGKESRKLTKYEENGVDLTEKKRSEIEKAESKPVHSPFLASEQSKYRFTQLAEDQLGIEPAGAKDPELITGKATIDPASGEVRFVTMEPSKMPAFVDSLRLTATFDERSMTKFTIKGMGGFLFIKKRFGVVSSFRDYEARAE
ncbi:MAG: hypothetical protein ACO1OB_27835 [Archangium sp.]